MKKLSFPTEIEATPQAVWHAMLEDDTYRQWTAPFCEGSYFEGSWAEGERIRFLGPNGDGMVAEIAAHQPAEYVSIRHLGEIKDGVEDTTSDAVKAWAPAHENYKFVPVPGGTRVEVTVDTLPDYEDFMQDAWPKALEQLKAISEEAARQ